MAVVALLGAGCASGPTCKRSYVAAPGPARPLVWSVDGGRMFLVGTYHAAGERDVPAAAWAALEQADVLVAEVDPDEDSDPEKTARLPRGQSLMRMLSDDDFTELSMLLELPAESLAPLKPWVAMALLTARAFRFPEPNMDGALDRRARERGIAREFLESWAEQVAALDAGVTGRDLSRAIRDFPLMRCALEDGVAAYRAGDGAYLGGALEGEAEAALLDARNARWLPKLEAYLAGERRVVVAVGVSHLHGERGIAAALAAAGHRVERVGAVTPP